MSLPTAAALSLSPGQPRTKQSKCINLSLSHTFFGQENNHPNHPVVNGGYFGAFESLKWYEYTFLWQFCFVSPHTKWYPLFRLLIWLIYKQFETNFNHCGYTKTRNSKCSKNCLSTTVWYEPRTHQQWPWSWRTSNPLFLPINTCLFCVWYPRTALPRPEPTGLFA